MNKIKFSFLVLILGISTQTYAVFNNIQDGDDVLASPVMQNFRHVNYGSVLKPVDSAGNNNDDTLDLGTNTVRWRNFYYSSQILSPDGSETTPNITNLDDTDTGIFYPTDNAIAFSTGATESFRVDNNQDIQMNSNTDLLMGENSIVYLGNSSLIDFGTNTIYDQNLTGSWDFDSGTLYVDSSNNRVGFGATNLAAFSTLGERLIVGSGSGNNSLTIFSDSTNKGFVFFADGTSTESERSQGIIKYDHSDNSLVFGTSGSDKVRIASNGSVGIGTTNPTNLLTINGNTDSNGSQIRLINDAGSATVIGIGGSSASSSITDTGGFFIYSPVTGTALRISSANGTVAFPDGIDPGYSGSSLKMKVLDIGDWNMDTTQTVDVSHGIGDEQLIRMVEVIIRDDGGSFTYPLNSKGVILGSYDTDVQGGVGRMTSTDIRLVRITSGFFDDTDFNSTSYNRGWVTIWYSSN